MKKILTFITICWAFYGKAQLNIVFYPMQAFELKPSAILKADIQNMGAQGSSLYFKGSIVNTATGEQVATVRTGIIEVRPGIKTLNESELAPQYTILSDVVNQTGYLPYGNYRFCLKGYLQNGVEEEVSACEEVEITPLSPPLLLSPENQSEVTEPYPLLVWLPPMPLGKEKLVYDLKLVEIFPNQTPYDAIQRNFAVLETFNINGTTLQYPANAIKLEDGKKYAWKVAVKTVDRKPVGETEIWWFEKQKVLSPNEPAENVNRNFVRLKSTIESDYIVIQNELKLVYEETFGNTHVTVTINTVEGKKIYDVVLEANQIGDNQFVIDLRNKGFRDKQFYSVEVTAPQRPNKYLQFKFVK